jgi:hypothetical protein
MRNKFGGNCYRCGRWVTPGTGHFERHGKGWRVQHGLHPGEGRVTCDEAKAAKAPANRCLMQLATMDAYRNADDARNQVKAGFEAVLGRTIAPTERVVDILAECDAKRGTP